MVAMDLLRFAALASVPLDVRARPAGVRPACWSWRSSSAAAKIAFNAASGAYLKALVGPDQLLDGERAFEATNWSSVALGPPLGGAAIGLFGPLTTIAADAVSYLLSALRDRGDPAASTSRARGAARDAAARLRAGELLDGWRAILGRPGRCGGCSSTRSSSTA